MKVKMLLLFACLISCQLAFGYEDEESNLLDDEFYYEQSLVAEQDEDEEDEEDYSLSSESL